MKSIEKMKTIAQILKDKDFSRQNLIRLLDATPHQAKSIFDEAERVKNEIITNKVYYRGLIEFSNICSKDCYYCGIRKSNKNLSRYELDEDSILKAAEFAYKHRYGSIVLQSGERTDKVFIKKIDKLLRRIKQISNGELGITLSVGEQDKEVFKMWFESGAHRYLLRIETSNKKLYYKIHPKNNRHDFDRRLKALYDLKELGYQTGTGVMIALPFQTTADLADDLIFFKNFDVDMIGMGPYIEHPDTPLVQYASQLPPLQERLFRTFKMIAILRLMMPDINIAAATALQAIDPIGREKALRIGANVIMPNITPTIQRKEYKLYNNKPCTDEGADDCTSCLEARIKMAGCEVAYGQWGDSKHFFARKTKKTERLL